MGHNLVCCMSRSGWNNNLSLIFWTNKEKMRSPFTLTFLLSYSSLKSMLQCCHWPIIHNSAFFWIHWRFSAVILTISVGTVGLFLPNLFDIFTSARTSLNFSRIEKMFLPFEFFFMARNYNTDNIKKISRSILFYFKNQVVL